MNIKTFQRLIDSACNDGAMYLCSKGCRVQRCCSRCKKARLKRYLLNGKVCEPTKKVFESLNKIDRFLLLGSVHRRKR